MGERVVTVKMPSTLVQELRRRTHAEHYLDLSEQIRSIVRQGCMRYAQPYSREIQRLRSDIERNMQQSASLTREQVLNELARMLRGGGQ